MHAHKHARAHARTRVHSHARTCGWALVRRLVQVWTTAKYILEHHVELMRNRHLDQIILCTVYGVCKVGARARRCLWASCRHQIGVSLFMLVDSCVSLLLFVGCFLLLASCCLLRAACCLLLAAFCVLRCVLRSVCCVLLAVGTCSLQLVMFTYENESFQKYILF